MAKKTALSRNVRRLRDESSLSQAGLARRAGKTRQFVQMVEAGRTGVSLDTLHALAKALGVHAGDLLEEPRKPVPRRVIGFTGPRCAPTTPTRWSRSTMGTAGRCCPGSPSTPS